LNVTVPEGSPAPGAVAVTTAVKMIACPYTAGLADEVTVVVVLALLTVCPPVRVPVLTLKLPSPEYSAVIAWLPTERELVV
jgi:hypothetical protein